MVEKRRVLVSILLMGSVIWIGACSKLPQASIDQADVALSGAADAEAAVYAEAEWDVAQQAMNQARAEVELQNAKLALIRSYKNAEALLADAKKTADQARQAAIDGKEAMRLRVEGAVAAIEGSLTAASDHLNALQSCRKRPKGFAADLQMLRGNTEGLVTQLGALTAAAEAEKYSEAETMARELQGQVDALLADLESARAKLGC